MPRLCAVSSSTKSLLASVAMSFAIIWPALRSETAEFALFELLCWEST